VVVGAGPCGATVLDELIANGVNADDILLVTKVETKGQRADGTRNIFERAKSIRDNGLLSKGAAGNLLNPDQISDPGEIWGVSCLPFSTNWSIASNNEKLLEAYGKTCSNWGVQATSITSQPSIEYPLTGEVLNQLSRKDLSNHLVKNLSGLDHSRLALKSQISGQSCTFDSKCFIGCDKDVPYRPSLEILKLRQKSEFKSILGKLVRIDTINKIAYLENDECIQFTNLYLAPGTEQTLEIIQNSVKNSENLSYLSSSVQLSPFFSFKSSSSKDFYESFLYTDLVFSISESGRQRGLIQVYLPTHEIAARILSTCPKKLISALEPFSGLIQRVLRHFGIIMLFHPGTSEVDSLHSIKSASKTLLRKIRISWGRHGLILMGFPSKYLLNNQTMHIGSLGTETESRGIDSAIFKKLASQQVYLCDTSVLPSLPPGPITALASAYARMIVLQSLKRVNN